MSGTQPVALYAMKVPPGNIPVPAVPDFAAMFRVSMAAIDPTAEPEYDDVDDKKPPRSTLKIIRMPGHIFDEDDSEDEDEDDEDDMLIELNGMDEDEDTSDEEENGGPSDPEKVKKAKTSHLAKAIAEQKDEEDGEDEDDDEEEMSEDDAKAAALLKKIMKRKSKGKGKATEDEKDDDEDLEDDEELEMEEIVVCTLDPEKNYQQTLDFVVGEDERIFFQVTGTHTVHLTGNYVIPTDDGQAQLYDDEEDEDEYDLSPDEDELEALEEDDVSSDELDDLADPRVTEIDTDESEKEPPKLAASANGKGKNKRPAPASDDEEDDEANLDDIMAKSLKAEELAKAVKEEPKKLTKSEKKKLKKLKKNDGEAAPATTANTGAKTTEPKKEAASTNGEKKVQFAKNLEQGPTPSATPPTKSDKKPEAKGTDGKATLGIKEVQGVIIDDRKLGTGPAAKKGNKVEMRYIGKLENGKVFDGKQKPEEAISSTNPTANFSTNDAGADKSSHKKRTKKGNRSDSRSEPAK